jgi:hypothetical protein
MQLMVSQCASAVNRILKSYLPLLFPPMLASCRMQATVLYVVQRGDCKRFSPADDCDPAYGALVRAAAEMGVRFYAISVELCCGVAAPGTAVIDQAMPLPKGTDAPHSASQYPQLTSPHAGLQQEQNAHKPNATAPLSKKGGDPSVVLDMAAQSSSDLQFCF